ncbi:MAG: polyphosphate polymerase domain-containing protein [FCB group bacterium]|nr:polyphosphate polymerase domain-containing protein [FCB group bacterium]
MNGRLEYKFLVPNSQLNLLRQDILPYVDVDPYVKALDSLHYTVRSIYCDTLRRDCYGDKIEGLRVRKKFRVRGYNEVNDSSPLFLEIKRKYINAISKNRAPIRQHDLHQFLCSGDSDKYTISLSNNGKEKRDAQRFLYHYYSQRLAPTILIVYEREAFFCKFDRSLRITFDKYLRSRPTCTFDGLFSETDMRSAYSGYFVLEVKFGGRLPSWLQNVLKNNRAVRLALSKYTICLDSHKRYANSSLPMNIRSINLDLKSNRVLERETNV